LIPVAIPLPDDGNAMWPLPHDYLTLTPEGQRLARVNACSQWLLPTTDLRLKATRFAGSVNFFDQWYLYPDWDEEFNPYFYDDDPVEPPAGHFAIYRMWAMSPRSIAIAPRGFAKSNCFRKTALLQMLTRPAYSFIYATSSVDNAEQTGQIIKSQFIGNKRIFDDMAPEFPDGRITPRRGEASFGVEMMYLNNGSWFRAMSAESRQRGGRPRVYALDDPEYDPKASTSMTILRSYMERLLFKVVMPMITRKDTSVRWLATFVSRRHYAWHAMMTELLADGSKIAKDPRFDQWARLILRAEYDDNGVQKSTWPSMWPLDRKARDADDANEGRVSLQEIKEMIGTHNYMAEYLAQPGESEDVYFGEITQEKHGWWLESPDLNSDLDPYSSTATICWRSKGDVVEKLPLPDFLTHRIKLFATVDTSYTATSDSDFKVCTVMGYDPVDAVLFVLDTWGGQVREPILIEHAFKMITKWRVPAVHVEVVRQSFSLYAAMESMVKQRADQITGMTPPRIIKLNPGVMDKTSKISALNYRFEHGLIKLPTWRRGSQPWRSVFEQFEQFNPDAESGGLAHDDFIDTIAMSMFVVRGRMERSAIKVDGEDDTLVVENPMEEIANGNVIDKKYGIHIAELMNLNGISVQDALGMMKEPVPQIGGSRV
jgi:phage terminase large subunit-like protein